MCPALVNSSPTEGCEEISESQELMYASIVFSGCNRRARVNISTYVAIILYYNTI